jgi:hypothetical protein
MPGRARASTIQEDLNKLVTVREKNDRLPDAIQRAPIPAQTKAGYTATIGGSGSVDLELAEFESSDGIFVFEILTIKA